VAVAVGVARVASRLYAVAAGSRLLGLRLPWAFGARVGEAVVAMSGVVLALRLLLPTASAATGPRRLIALLPLLALALVGAAVFAVALRTLGGLEETDRRRLEQLQFPGRQVLLRFLAS